MLIIFAVCIQYQENQTTISMYSIKSLNRGGQTYETPSVKQLEFLSEGLLCVSALGATIDPGTEDNWGTLE